MVASTDRGIVLAASLIRDPTTHGRMEFAAGPVLPATSHTGTPPSGDILRSAAYRRVRMAGSVLPSSAGGGKPRIRGVR